MSAAATGRIVGHGAGAAERPVTAVSLGCRRLSGARDGERLRLVHDCTGEVRSIALGERVPGSEMLSLHVVEGLFLVLTECGVIALDASGRERWQIGGITWDWRLLAAAGGVIWLADTHDNVLGIDAESGREAGP